MSAESKCALCGSWNPSMHTYCWNCGANLAGVKMQAEIESSANDLLDFIAEEYDVKTIDDFTCSFHKKLATVLMWERKPENNVTTNKGETNES